MTFQSSFLHYCALILPSSSLSALRRWVNLFVTVVALGGVLPTLVSADEAPADIGTISYFIGSKPGGGYDRYGRLIAKHLELNLPGSTFIPENRASGGGVPALRTLRDATPDDRMVMLFNTGILLSELAGRDGMDITLGDFNWIGKASSESRVLLVHTKTGISTFQELREFEPGLVFVTADYGNSSHVQTSMINNAFDLGFHIIPGFGGSEAEAALLRGEVDGIFVSESNVAALVEANIAIPLLVFGETTLDVLQNVLDANEVTTNTDEELTDFLSDMN